ncbi:YdcF family protein [candidate division KSB1 bacterium]|nr:YdcF family protein [candidate division KSB1 bacterium]
MPPTTQTVDALIVEGGQTVSEIKMTASLNMVQANQARKIVISLNTMEESATFAVRNYAALLAAKLDSIGLSERQYFIIHIAVGDPFTYNTARKLSDLIGNDVRSIGIVQDNFHIRRSYLTYKKAFAKKNVTVYPCTFFIYADMNNWWKSLGGIRRIFGEYVKLAFYFYHGYI